MDYQRVYYTLGPIFSAFIFAALKDPGKLSILFFNSWLIVFQLLVLFALHFLNSFCYHGMNPLHFLLILGLDIYLTNYSWDLYKSLLEFSVKCVKRKWFPEQSETADLFPSEQNPQELTAKKRSIMFTRAMLKLGSCAITLSLYFSTTSEITEMRRKSLSSISPKTYSDEDSNSFLVYLVMYLIYLHLQVFWGISLFNGAKNKICKFILYAFIIFSQMAVLYAPLLISSGLYST